MTVTADAPAAAPASEPTTAALAPTGFAAVLGSGDHKVVGRLWLVAALAHMAVVGVAAVLLSAERVDSAVFDVLGADWVVQAETFRFIGGIFLFALPLTIGLATIVVPLQVGASTIAFPRAAAAAAWTYLLGGGLLLGAYAIDGGPGGTDVDGIELFVVAFGLVLVSQVVAWVCLVATVFALRAPGLGVMRVPLFAWSIVVAGGVWILTLPVLGGLSVLSFLDVRYDGFLGSTETALYDRIAWAFHPPTIYALAIPVLGIVGSIIPVFSQTRHQRHRVAVGLIGAFGALTLGAWTAPSLEGDLPWLYDGPWVVVSIAPLLPLLGLVGLWALTLRAGRPVLKSPLLFAVVAVLLLLLGLAAGAAQAVEAIETIVEGPSTPLFGTAWTTGVTALFLLATAAGLFAGAVYWAPKVVGSLVPEGGARLAATLVLVGTAVGCIAELVAGLLGQPATVALAAAERTGTLETLGLVTTVADGVLVLGAVVFVLLLARAAASATDPGGDPWAGHTLEWATASPPAVGNFASLPKISSEAPLYDLRHGQDATPEAGA
ncbi:MAG TPA: cbb3-type cytochrome c oxidase subunit I [Acidimicrobiales bacterium]|nr:cbb3-type cytochrome c oxidase subunit I [Acidimicrobiales bacterium]